MTNGELTITSSISWIMYELFDSFLSLPSLQSDCYSTLFIYGRLLINLWIFNVTPYFVWRNTWSFAQLPWQNFHRHNFLHARTTQPFGQHDRFHTDTVQYLWHKGNSDTLGLVTFLSNLSRSIQWQGYRWLVKTFY